MRSKMSTFESTPIPIVSTNPAMPGSVMTAPMYAISPSRMIRLKRSANDRVDAGQLVVGDHEEHDQDEADDRRLDAGSD